MEYHGSASNTAYMDTKLDQLYTKACAVYYSISPPSLNHHCGCRAEQQVANVQTDLAVSGYQILSSLQRTAISAAVLCR